MTLHAKTFVAREREAERKWIAERLKDMAMTDMVEAAADILRGKCCRKADGRDLGKLESIDLAREILAALPHLHAVQTWEPLSTSWAKGYAAAKEAMRAELEWLRTENNQLPHPLDTIGERALKIIEDEERFAASDDKGKK